MRKIIVDLKIKPEIAKAQGELYKKIESIRVLELLKLDFEEGIKIGLGEYTMKEGYSIEDVKLPYMEILNVLKSEGNKYTCVMKVKVPDEFKAMMKKFDLAIIWDSPTVLSEEKMVYSCIGDEKDLKKFLEVIKLIGEVQQVRFLQATYHEHDMISILTEKQKEIIIEAKKNGYYEYPRKINSEELSHKVGISKGTVVEHLRKAEVRLMGNILAGY